MSHLNFPKGGFGDGRFHMGYARLTVKENLYISGDSAAAECLPETIKQMKMFAYNFHQ
jgi:hypothetical protein